MLGEGGGKKRARTEITPRPSASEKEATKDVTLDAVMNDNAVHFVEDKIHPGSTFDHETAPYYLNADNSNRLDCWCFAEKDDPASGNN